MPDESKIWTWSGRLSTLWGLVERTAIYTGFVVVFAAGPTGHVIGGLVALYYVIPLSALGVSLLVVGFRRQVRVHGALAPVSPLRRDYTRERIRIAELADQTGGAIRNVSFFECEIVGPAVLCGGGGRIDNLDPHLFALDEESGFIEMPHRSGRPDGAIAIGDTTFKSCAFHRITWALPKEQIDASKAQYGFAVNDSETAANSVDKKDAEN